MNCILHVGAGKCGSSSLQHALSLRPVFSAEDGSANYEYVCINPVSCQSLQRKAKIVHSASFAPHGYAVSINALRFVNDEIYLNRICDDFSKSLSSSVVQIISSEAWIDQAHLFRDYNLLPRLGLKAKVIIFVRPQISWLNSAWWQWGAWAGQEFEAWLEGFAQHRAKWADRVLEWQQVPGVESVVIHSTFRDVVEVFFEEIGATLPDVEKTNQGLDEEVLRFYQRNRSFRPHEYAPLVDFVLQKRLPPAAKGTPWVIPHDVVARLIDYYRDNNKHLLSLVSESEREIIENDPRWWDAAAFRHHEVRPSGPIMQANEELENLARRAIQAVVSLDEQLRSALAHVPKDQQLAVAQEQIARTEQLLAAEKRKWVPQHLRKAVSINGIRRLMSL